ncbi:MAG: MATE family efflux transporter, partial [Ruthenibacterium sp.]
MKIGFPAILEYLCTAFASIIDSQMVSSLGVASISAVSVTNQPRLFILSCFFALFTVMTSLTAKYVGQNDRKSVNRLLLAGILCTTLASIVISVLSVALATPIMRLCSNQPDTMANSVLYFRILMGGIIANTLYMGINAILRGCGKTIYTFLSNVIFCGVNIFFNYLLIEGHWGFPAWGIGGAAIATVLGTVAAL